MNRHEAWVSETLHSNVLFDAALRNVSQRFGPEKLTDRREFKNAAGLSRERIGIRSREAAADRMLHFARVEPKNYPGTRDMVREIVYECDSPSACASSKAKPPPSLDGAAGMPVTPAEHPDMIRIGRTCGAPAYTGSSIDFVNFGGVPPMYETSAPSAEKPARHRAHGASDNGRSKALIDRMVDFGAEELDRSKALLASPRRTDVPATPRGSAVHLYPSQWAALLAGGDKPLTEEELPRSGVRVLSYQPTPRKATGRAAGTCNPLETSAQVVPPRSAAVGSRGRGSGFPVDGGYAGVQPRCKRAGSVVVQSAYFTTSREKVVSRGVASVGSERRGQMNFPGSNGFSRAPTPSHLPNTGLGLRACDSTTRLRATLVCRPAQLKSQRRGSWRDAKQEASQPRRLSRTEPCSSGFRGLVGPCTAQRILRWPCMALHDIKDTPLRA